MNAYLAELLGTALLVLLGNGVVANVVLQRTKGHGGGWLLITAGWGMAVFAAVATVQRFSGAHINPAVTVGLAVAGEFEWVVVPGYLVAQFAGAFAGSVLVLLAYYRHFSVTDDPAAKLGTFATGPAIRAPLWNLATEAIGTFVLVLVCLYFASATMSVGGEDQPVGLGSVGAIPVGLLVFAIGMSLGGPTGYAINPARDLGPRIAHALLPVPGRGSSDWGYSWIPVLGPLLGAVVAAGVRLLAGSS
jgi:glycerol uptake facilitator protein